MNPFHRHGDISELSIFLIGMAAVGMVLIAIGAR